MANARSLENILRERVDVKEEEQLIDLMPESALRVRLLRERL